MVQTMPISLCVGLGTITAVTVRTIPSSLSDGEIRNGCLKNHSVKSLAVCIPTELGEQ